MDVRKAKAIVRIQERDGFAVNLLVDADECGTKINRVGPNEGRQPKVTGRHEDNGFRGDEKLLVDLETYLCR